MPRAFTPKVVTANDLIMGDVVYFTKESAWTRDLNEAEVLIDQADADLRQMEAAAQNHAVVGVYLADVTVEDGQPKPAHFREAFRSKGPSNYFHGKQERL